MSPKIGQSRIVGKVHPLTVVALVALCLSGMWAGSYLVVARSPILALSEEEHNFGAIQAGTDVRHVFKIRNNGGQPLVIKDVGVSCGCVKEARMLGSTMIPPGQEGKLQVRFEPPVYAKSVAESVVLSTNDPTTPTKRLSILAEVKPNIGAQPSTINFGIVDASQLPVSQESIITTNLPIFKAKSAQLQGKATNLRMKSIRVNDSQWKLKITLPKNTPLGPIGGRVKLKLGMAKPQDIPVLGQVVGDIYAEPSEIYQKVPLDSKAFSQTIEIKTNSSVVKTVKVLHISQSIKESLRVSVQRSSDSFMVKVSTLEQWSTQTKSIRDNLLLEVGLTDGRTQILSVPIVLIKLLPKTM